MLLNTTLEQNDNLKEVFSMWWGRWGWGFPWWFGFGPWWGFRRWWW